MNTRFQVRTIGFAACGIALVSSIAAPARAQVKPMPTGSVLIFPAVVDGVEGDAAKLISEVVTDALRSRLKTLGASVVVFSGKLPSIQRAREEQQIRKEDAEAGPLDDRRKAQRIAEIVGAGEYLSVFVDGYSFNQGTRSAAFNLNVNRYLTADGAPVGSFVKGQSGMSPIGVGASRQEGSAIARAMQIGGEQSVGELYPAATILENAKVAPRQNKSSSRSITRLFFLAIAGLFSSTR